MTFLTDDELTGLGIEQSVFHIVGPSKEDHFKLLAAFDATDHADFFLGRIRSIHGGNRYRFLADSPVRAQLGRIDASAAAFQEESEKLAIAFNEEHGGGTAIGAFLLFSLSCPTGRLFALLKFEDEKVLSYDFNDSGGGKRRPSMKSNEPLSRIEMRCKRRLSFAFRVRAILFSLPTVRTRDDPPLILSASCTSNGSGQRAN